MVAQAAMRPYAHTPYRPGCNEAVCSGHGPFLSGGGLLGWGRLGRRRIGERAVSVDAPILLREHRGDAQHDLIRRALEVVAAAFLARLTQRHWLAVAHVDGRRPGAI